MTKSISLYEGLGFVEFIDKHGDDFRVAQAARVSYDQGLKGAVADTRLICYLMKHKHTSPFEQCAMTFIIKMPIYVMRQLVRHRTLKLNEVSGRYSELPDEQHVPIEFRVQDTANKQGSLASNELDHNELSTIVDRASSDAYAYYQDLLARGVAKEQARIILPLNTMTKIMVTCDLNNWMKFLILRLDSHAQLEIRQLAACILYYMDQQFPIITQAFTETVLHLKGINFEDSMELINK